jgi:TonB family protein
MKISTAIIGFLLLVPVLSFSQETGDTTIYTAVEEMPRFPVPACEELDTTASFKNQCAQQALLAFMYENLNYPLEARQNGNEGTVVSSFVIEKDGSLTNPQIVKDIGGGTGLEVLRIINALAQSGIKWIPGKQQGQAVRTRFTLPIRFKLEEALPYTLVGRDSIFTKFDTPLEFKGGDEALKDYLTNRLKYPTGYEDSCKVGRVELQLLIRKNGEVRILDMIDYNDLGFDFWYEAIDAATSTIGKWNVATFEGRPVSTAYEISLPFSPTAEACQSVVDNYKQASLIAEEGAQLFNNEEKEAGLAKLSEAVEMMPNNANFRIMRGQAYMDLNRFDEACTDLRLARRIALINWYDDVLPIICK